MDKDKGKGTGSGAVELKTCNYAAAADRLHCSIGTVRRLVKTGQISGFSWSGNPRIVTHILVRSVEAFIERANAGRRKDGGR